MLLRNLFLAAALTTFVTPCLAIDFPGPQPGNATIQSKGAEFSLSNRVISASWTLQNGALHLHSLTNHLTGKTWDQANTELFRISTKASLTANANTKYLGIRIDASKIETLISNDGQSWTTLTTIPRSSFSGNPTIVRVGKMSSSGDATDYSSAGEAGKSRIDDFRVTGKNDTTLLQDSLHGTAISGAWKSEISKRPNTKLTETADGLQIDATANNAAFIERALPSGATLISCRVAKETDKGDSWGPGISVRWPNGKYVLVNQRTGDDNFSVNSSVGQQAVSRKPQNFPSFNLPASQFVIVGKPSARNLAPNPKTVRLDDHFAGKEITATLKNAATGIVVDWSASLRDGSNAIQQTFTLHATGKPVNITGLEFLDLRMEGAEQVGSVPGSPAIAGQMFFGTENPVAENQIANGELRNGFTCKLPLASNESYTFKSEFGVYPKGQLRRAFLFALERERARPSTPFLEYNCWYDFAPNESRMLGAIKAYGEELVHKRGVKLNSVVMDDGWDNFNKGLWTINKQKFPHGFAPLKQALTTINSHLGIWISPLGGYSGNKERTEWARKMGLIPANGDLDFSYPRYYKWFRDKCLKLMKQDGVNYFKWDKAGQGVSPHFMALLRMADELRAANHDLFLNVTVGTWPSPFWLDSIDCTWRTGSGDVSWFGKGDDREQWLSYRDMECYRLIVKKAPLYPLNSIMHHGIVLGHLYQGERVAKAGAHLKHGARSYFATGAMLQELYLSPDLMTNEAWDDVAAAAKWAHANAAVLVDAHWVGGDPGKLQTYGYAAWSPKKATLMVRNPDDKPQTITLDVAKVWNPPKEAAQSYQLKSPYSDQRVQTLTLEAGKPQTIQLQPFEVLVFDATPVR